MISREDGFKKALCQIALFAPEMDSKEFNVLKDVKEEELVRESEMRSYEDVLDRETTCKAGDVEATSNSTPTSNPPTS